MTELKGSNMKIKPLMSLIAIVILLLLTQVAIAQDDELIRLTKYQLEAKKPGIAALLGVISPIPGLGHYYAGEVSGLKRILLPYAAGIGAIVIGFTFFREKEEDWLYEEEEELSLAGATLVLTGLIIVLATKIVEPFDAYDCAVKYNAKLLKKYNLNLATRRANSTFALTYRF